MIRRLAVIFSGLFLVVMTVAFGTASAGAQTTVVTAPCNSIAEDGGTPLSSTNESSCLNTWLSSLNLTTNTTPIVWDLEGQSYEVDNGITIAGAQDFTILGSPSGPPQYGYFYDAETPGTVTTGTPAIDLKGANPFSNNPIVPRNDALEDLVIEGAFDGGGLRKKMENAAGIESEGVQALMISDVNTMWTYGDGIHLAPFLNGSANYGNTSGNVDNVTTNHRRCGIAPIGVDGLTIDGASMTGTGPCAIDMENDGNTPIKTINLENITTDSYIELDNVQGPVSISNWTVTENVDPDLLDESDSTPLTITGGTVQCGETSGPYPCFDVHQTPASMSIW